MSRTRILVAAAVLAAGLSLAGCKPGEGWPTLPGPTAKAECDCAKDTKTAQTGQTQGALAGGPEAPEVPGPPPPLKVAEAAPAPAVASAPPPRQVRHPAPRRATHDRYVARADRAPAVHRAAGYATDHGNVYDYAAIYGARSATMVSRSSYEESTYDSGWVSQGSEQGHGGYVEQGYGPAPYAPGPCPVRCAY